MASTTYDFKKVTLTIDGEIMTGFMDGSVITIEKNEDDVTLHVGADSSTTWSETNDPTGTITPTFKQTSPSLVKLRRLAKAKKAFAVSLKDNNSGNLVFNSSDCRIQKTPGGEWGNEISGVEVPILMADYNPTA